MLQGISSEHPDYVELSKRMALLEHRLRQAGMSTDFLHGEYQRALDGKFTREEVMFKIGQLAKLAEVTPDTVRYYEKQGMMDHNVRTEGGYRLYTEQDLQRLRFIRYAKQLGFTLETIAELLSIRVDPEHHTCQESKSIVDARLSEVESKLAELTRMRESLKRLSDACCGTAHTSNYCSILEALEQGASDEKGKKVADGTLIFIPPAVLSPRFITPPFTGALS